MKILDDFSGGIGLFILPFIVIILIVEVFVFWQVFLFLIAISLLAYFVVKLIKRAI